MLQLVGGGKGIMVNINVIVLKAFLPKLKYITSAKSMKIKSTLFIVCRSLVLK